MAQDLQSRRYEETTETTAGGKGETSPAAAELGAARRAAVIARQGWRAAVLSTLALLALPLYRRVSQVSGAFLSNPSLLLWPLLGLALIYIVACLLILPVGRSGSHRVALVELGVLLLGGILFRVAVFGTPPLLSHDAYRYAWDPYLLAHGVSPYLHAPHDPLLRSLRDGAIWPNLNWPTSPTIYPPGAQAFFFMVYLVKPLSIWAVKTAITAADAIVAILLLLLLRRRRMDPRLALIYWWSPIAVIEFAGNAHLDVVAVAWLLLALLLADRQWRGARFATGVALGMATLTKFYPLLFALAIARRRDRAFYAGLGGIILLGYLPFLGGGSRSTGFLATYVGQRFPDQGVIVVAISKLVGLMGGGDALVIALQAVGALALCGMIVWWRIRSTPTTEATILALTALYFALAPHTFPWYVVVVLPLVALLWGSAPRPLAGVLPHPSRGKRAVVERTRYLTRAPVLAMWLFAVWIPLTYIFFAPGGRATLFVWFSLGTVVVGAMPWILSRPFPSPWWRGGKIGNHTPRS